ncbi:MAG: hypothetical protein K6E76_08985 [Patescibacteria group bacterium]|nr:hypothetical protein [Patescibacteria group bacterium]
MEAGFCGESKEFHLNKDTYTVSDLIKILNIDPLNYNQQLFFFNNVIPIESSCNFSKKNIEENMPYRSKKMQFWEKYTNELNNIPPMGSVNDLYGYIFHNTSADCKLDFYINFTHQSG